MLSFKKLLKLANKNKIIDNQSFTLSFKINRLGFIFFIKIYFVGNLLKCLLVNANQSINI